MSASGHGDAAGKDGGVSWLETSPADFDRRRAVRGHKREAQPGLFYVATPTAARKDAAVRDEMPGQDDLFGGEL